MEIAIVQLARRPKRTRLEDDGILYPLRVFLMNMERLKTTAGLTTINNYCTHGCNRGQ
jgi:hypothetical protein